MEKAKEIFGKEISKWHDKVKKILLDENGFYRKEIFKSGLWGKLRLTASHMKAIIEAAENYNEKLEAKESFKKDLHGFNEDTMMDLQTIIKDKRKRMIELQEKTAEAKNNEKDDILAQIENLKAEIIEHEKERKELRDIFEKDYVKSIDLAELKAVLKKRIRQKIGMEKIMNFWSAGLGIIFLLLHILLIVYNMLAENNLASYWGSVTFFVVTLLTLIASFRTVEENWEWNISLLGKYVTTWEAGFNFKIPVFMNIDRRVFMGILKETLYMDERSRSDENEKISAKVDFANGSAEVIAELFFRIFDSFKATYFNKEIVESIKEKMEAGIRAYYGPIPIDTAIETRADIFLRRIINQGATEADKFREWGSIIDSLAITDIKLSGKLEEKRNSILFAEKDLQASKIDQKRAEVESKTAEIRGGGRGKEIKSLANEAGIDATEATSFDLSTKRYDAWGKAKILIAGDTEGNQPAYAGAVAGVAAQTSATLNEKTSEKKKSEKPEKKGGK